VLGRPTFANDAVLTVEHTCYVVRGEVGDAQGSILPRMLSNLTHDRKRILHGGRLTSYEPLCQRLDDGDKRVAKLVKDSVEKVPSQSNWRRDTARRPNDLVNQREPSIG